MPSVRPARSRRPAYSEGTFTTLKNRPKDSLPHVALGDINGDGLLDIVSSDTTNSDGDDETGVSVAFGQPSGGFTAFPDLFIPTPVAGGPIAVGDLNGDGLTDVVVADLFFDDDAERFYNRRLIAILQTPAGTWVDTNGKAINLFSPTVGVNGTFAVPETIFIQEMFLADVDVDLDLTMFQYRGDESRPAQTLTYFNGGDGTFDPSTGEFLTFDRAVATTEQTRTDVAFGDLNNDGRPDLVAAAFNVGAWVLTNTARSGVVPTVTVGVDDDRTIDFSFVRSRNLGEPPPNPTPAPPTPAAPDPRPTPSAPRGPAVLAVVAGPGGGPRVNVYDLATGYPFGHFLPTKRPSAAVSSSRLGTLMGTGSRT